MTTKKNILLNNDGLYNEYRNNYEGSIDFFTEKKIEVTNKDAPEENKKAFVDGMEDLSLEHVQGLENLVKQFSQHNINPNLIKLYQDSSDNNPNEIQGSEAIHIDADPIGNAFIRTTNDCLYLIEDNIKKLQKRVADVDKKRRKGSIRTKPIKMKSIVKKLGTSKNVTSDPLWIPAAVGDSIKFSGNLMSGIYALKAYINDTPDNRHEITALNLKIFSDVGKTIVGGSSNKSIYSSDPLPGNTVFNLKLSNFIIGTMVTVSYTDAKTPVNVVSETCLPTAHLVDKCTDALENYLYLFTKSKNDLLRVLSDMANTQIKADKLKSGPRHRIVSNLSRLIDIVKRLLKAMFKHVNHVTDALYDFILQGIK